MQFFEDPGLPVYPMTLVRRPWTTILQTHFSFMKAFLLPSCFFFSAVNSIAE